MKRKFLITILILTLGLFSCQKDNLFPQENSGDESQNHKITDGVLVLGKKIDDPYAISNMQKAYSELKSTEYSPIDAIKPNKKYLRFLPKNEEEWDQLKSDTSLVLFDFPLDYEIEVYGTYYHDPELPDTAITWQYCVVPIDKEIPTNIKYELLYDVFIPDFNTLDLDSTVKSTSSEVDFYERLVYKSYEITGNIKNSNDTRNQTKSIFSPKRWNPSGRITVYDNDFGYIPLVGAEVHARWSTHVETGLTGTDGSFKLDGFIFEVNYAIKWEREDFDIRSENWGQAWYNGPKQKGSWDLDIAQGGMSWVYAHIHRGAYTYWYDNSFGIKTPPKNSFWSRKVKIGAFDADGRSFFQRARRWSTFPEIEVYKQEDGSDCKADRLYYMIIHELVHSSHWDLDKSAYGDSPSILKESWAVCAANIITSATYGSDDYDWQHYSFSDIKNPNSLESKYTPLGLDLMDNYNQRAMFGGNLNYPIDRVSGYSLYQIEESLRGATSLENWRDNLKNKFNNPTENFVDELFQNYTNL